MMLRGAILLLCFSTAAAAEGDATTQPATAPAGDEAVLDGVQSALSALQGGAGVSSVLKAVALVTVLSIAPAILVMVTSFTRVVVVLGLLRQALATQQTPPNQVLFGLALLITVAVMAPVYQQVHREAIGPYVGGKMDAAQAVRAGEVPVRAFMIRQIEAGGNTDDVYLFLKDDLAGRADMAWKDVPTTSLIPAFVVSELKIAFLMGFRVFLPFVIIDMLVGSVLVSMGMLMLPPAMISLPFKLLLFVLADGWHLVVGTLLTSFG